VAEKEREKMAGRERRVKTGEQNIIVVRYYSIVQQVLMRIRLSREGDWMTAIQEVMGQLFHVVSYAVATLCRSLP
jgi:hypothetical protein